MSDDFDKMQIQETALHTLHPLIAMMSVYKINKMINLATSFLKPLFTYCSAC